ncbi:hypothetical protein DV737_g377, partial [Chaetothyriales sp. CBS 132003]
MATDLDIVTTNKTKALTNNPKTAEPKYYPRTAFAYIAQLEHEYLSRHKLTVCNHCLALAINSPQPLKQCVGCRLVDYCVWAQGDVLADFQRWLDLCEESGVLPEWWAWEDRMECLLQAINRGGKEKENGGRAEKKEDKSIYDVINQDNLIQRYDSDTSIRNALGMFAELVVGYDGKGRATDDKWYLQFQEFMDLHPQERLRLIQGTIDAVEGVKGEHAELLAGKKEEEASG